MQGWASLLGWAEAPVYGVVPSRPVAFSAELPLPWQEGCLQWMKCDKEALQSVFFLKSYQLNWVSGGDAITCSDGILCPTETHQRSPLPKKVNPENSWLALVYFRGTVFFYFAGGDGGFCLWYFLLLLLFRVCVFFLRQ